MQSLWRPSASPPGPGRRRAERGGRAWAASLSTACPSLLIKRHATEGLLRAVLCLVWSCVAAHRTVLQSGTGGIRCTPANLVAAPQHFAPSTLFCHCALNVRSCCGAQQGGALVTAATRLVDCFTTAWFAAKQLPSCCAESCCVGRWGRLRRGRREGRTAAGQPWDRRRAVANCHLDAHGPQLVTSGSILCAHASAANSGQLCAVLTGRKCSGLKRQGRAASEQLGHPSTLWRRPLAVNPLERYLPFQTCFAVRQP